LTFLVSSFRLPLLMRRALHVHPSSASRILAAGLAALVWTLSLLAYAPTAHEHLHDDAHHEDHHCAIVLLAQGVDVAASAVRVPVPEFRLTTLPVAAPAEVVLPEARLLPPACGPPAV
jgi:hypothetical protein